MLLSIDFGLASVLSGVDGTPFEVTVVSPQPNAPGSPTTGLAAFDNALAAEVVTINRTDEAGARNRTSREDAFAGVDEPTSQAGEIHGVKWNDLNGDGIWNQPDEPALPDWTIYLDLNHNGELDIDEPSQVTDVNGQYAFIDLSPDTYIVAEVRQPGWEQTSPGFGSSPLPDPIEVASSAGARNVSAKASSADAALTFYVPPLQHLFELGSFLSMPSAEIPLDIAFDFLTSQADLFGLTGDDLDSFVVTDQYVSQNTGVTHIYLGQTFGGLKILNATINVNVTADGQIINVGSSFVSGLADGQAKYELQPALSATESLLSLASEFGWALDEPPAIVNSFNDVAQTTILAAGELSREPMSVNLSYVPMADGGIELAWNLLVETVDGEHAYEAFVSAIDGTLLYWADGVRADSYNVYALPKESPSDGVRTLAVDPADATASPLGWHDTNGIAGAEYSITRGNNVYAYADRNDDNVPDVGSAPDGGAGLIFDFPIDLGQDPGSYLDAAVTNLFYWNNVLHDIHYQYGFDEAAGNFQVNNYGQGGLGGDAVRAEAQDGSFLGSRNNANFYTPADGSAPRMQMFLWDLSSPLRDGDLDAGIIAHEYGHGVSTRLTGGPSNVGALNANQSGGMGEGWSDWHALILTQTATDLATDARGIGTYAMGQASTGPGIRAFTYTYDMSINPRTYGDIAGLTVPHGVGEVWGATLWDLTWALTDGNNLDPSLPDPGLGFDPDLYNGVGGNNLAMQLVMDGMKLQPALPTFLDARDAILLADQVLTDGANQMTIWTVFARRGMGFSADDGGNADNLNVTEAFDLPTTSEGNVGFDATSYEVGGTVTVRVLDIDLNGGGALEVAIVSSGGDSEVLSLIELGAGVFEGSIQTVAGEVVVDDGVLNVAAGHVITVTYLDADDGTGNPAVVTDTANIVAFTDIYTQDFESGLRPGETVYGAFAVNNTNAALNNGTLMLGHPGNYSDNEYSYYELTIDLTDFRGTQLKFDYAAQIEDFWDGVNVLASSGSISAPGDLITPISGLTYDSASGVSTPIGTTAYDGDGLIDTGVAVFDLSAFDGQSVNIRIQFGSDTSVTFPGFNIENLVVRVASISLGGTHTVVLGAGEIITGIDFGNWQPPPGEIHGSKWNDLNGDGIWDQQDEPGLAGWTIYLDLNNNGELDTDEPSQITDTAGEYAFIDLPANTYTVVEVQQPGWEQTAPAPGRGSPHVIEVGIGQIVTGIDFGNWQPPPGEIHGSIWNDADSNGVWDLQVEPGLAGWTIYLDLNNNGALDSGEPLQVTDTEGAYAFVDLPSDTYTVVEVQQPGWQQTAPGSRGRGEPATYTVLLGPGQIVSDIDFGNAPYLIIDNRGSGPEFSSTFVGSDWQEYGHEVYYGDSTTARLGGVTPAGRMATFRWDGLAAGLYRVYGTWFPDPNRDDAVAYSIKDNTVVEETLTINQERLSADLVHAGSSWQLLGEYHIEYGSLVVEISEGPTAEGFLDVDAMLLEPVGPVPDELTLSISAAVISENGGSSSVTVTRNGDTSIALSVALTSNDLSEATVPMNVVIAAGETSASFDITAVDDQEADGTQTVSITASAAGYLGGIATLEVSDDEWEYRIIDNRASGAGYSSTFIGPDWQDYGHEVYYGGATTARPAGLTPAGRMAIFSWDGLTAGLYRVYGTWFPDANRDEAVAYRIKDGSFVEETLSINQEQLSADLAHDGSDWQLLGVYDIEYGSLVVEISEGLIAEGFLEVDAMLLEPVGPMPDQLTLSISDAVISENGGSSSVTVTRNGDSNAELVVTLASNDLSEATVPLSVTIAAGDSSASFVITAIDDLDTDGSQTVTITASADSYLSGIATVEVADDEWEYRIIDNRGSGPGYSSIFVGPDWQDYGHAAYYGGSTTARPAGVAAAERMAIFTWDGLTDGLYRVYGTWFPDPNRDDAVAYSIKDATNIEETLTINQELLSPNLVHGGSNWQLLGEYDIEYGSLVVEISAGLTAEGFLDVDAMLLAPVGPVPDQLTLNISNAVISENGGSSNVTVTRNGDSSDDLIVMLASNDLSEATVPLSVTIAAGETSASFVITAVDDLESDGPQSVIITASAESYLNGSATLDVADDEWEYQIIDNRGSGPGYSSTFVGPDWQDYVHAAYYGGTTTARAAGVAAAERMAIFTWDGLTDGLYRVYGTWFPDRNRDEAVVYSIKDATALEETLTVNQERLSADLVHDGSSWQLLGEYHIENGSLVVEISQGPTAEGFLDVDAMLLEPVGPVPADLTSQSMLAEVTVQGLSDETPTYLESLLATWSSGKLKLDLVQADDPGFDFELAEPAGGVLPASLKEKPIPAT